MARECLAGTTGSRPANVRLLAPLAAAALAACGLGGTAPSVTMPSRAEHGERFFPIAAGTAHAESGCNECHGTYDSFARFDCVTCHAGTAADADALQTTHANESGYPDVSVPNRSLPSAACYLCHSDGSADGIDPAVHTASYFPIGAGTAHAGARCSECHVDPSVRSALGCAGCHGHEQATMATAHALVKPDPSTGYTFSSARCVRCHADSQVDRVASHTPFAITSGKHGPVENGQCLSCHPSPRADKPYGAEFGVQECLGCHERADTDARHVGQNDYAYTTADCLRCHPAGIAGGD